MRATVRFKDGSRQVCQIVGIEDDGSGGHGYAVNGIWYVPVSQSTNHLDSQGRIIQKDWDEIVNADWIDKEDFKRLHS